MRWFSAATAVLAMVLLAGCVSQEEFEARRKLFQDSAAVRQQAQERCVRGTWGMDNYQLRQLALALKTSESNAPTMMCRNIVAAFAAGKLSYKEMTNLRRVSEAKLVRIAQGRY